MVWVPPVRVEVAKVATPLAMVPVPRVVEPSRNVTVPVAPVVTVAVNVTDWLMLDGFTDEVSVTVEAVLLTVWVSGAETTGL